MKKSLNFIKRIFTKRYCQNCETIKSIRDDVQIFVNDETSKNWDKIVEDIITDMNTNGISVYEKYKEENSYFVITVEYNYIFEDTISDIKILGYLIRRNNLKKDIAAALYANVNFVDNNPFNKINNISIESIKCDYRHRGQGYGTKIMECFFEVIKQFDTDKIVGVFSPEDENDEKSEGIAKHFYEKFGFEINESNIWKYLH